MAVRYNNGELFSSLLYAHNIYKLSSGNKKKIDELAAFMKKNPNARVVVTSHASLIGTDEYNKKLSERRMLEVVEYLVEAGISEDRFKGQHFGEDNPFIDCKVKNCSEEDLRQNRTQ
jgi:outer membrane protein OmpA-like peptidoglycan-associated protein